MLRLEAGQDGRSARRYTVAVLFKTFFLFRFQIILVLLRDAEVSR
jgi:hypothetical protein